MKARRPTLKDVGALAQVDPSIASRVLAGEARRVAPATRDRILAAAAELGWTPHQAAKSLRTGRSSILALIVPNLTNAAYSAMIKGAQHEAAARDHVLLVADTADPASDLLSAVRRIGQQADGVIFGSALPSDPVLEELERSSIPTILLNRRGQGDVSAVVGDDAAGARLAAEHLLDLGHRRIGVVAGPTSVDTAIRRVEGFREALALRGVELSFELHAGFDIESAARAMRDELSGASSVTAVFAAGGLSASLGVIQAAREIDIKIPTDLSLVGFDETEIAAFLTPSLTTVRMPHDQMGRTAVAQLIQRIGGTYEPEDIVVGTPELVVRETTSVPKGLIG